MQKKDSARKANANLLRGEQNFCDGDRSATTWLDF